MDITKAFCRNREFEQAIADNRERLYRLAFAWCHNPDIADDLVQDACSKALKRRKQLRDMDSVGPWLFQILVNTWRDYLRCRKEHVEFDDTAIVEEMTPETVTSRFETVQRVRSTCMKLPLVQREVLTLVELERFSYAEVAEILDIPIGTVMSRLHRARCELKELLLKDKDSRHDATVVVGIGGYKA